MALVSDIITQAYREDNLKPIGTVPTSDEIAEALVLLNSFVAMLFGSVIGRQALYLWPTPPARTEPYPSHYPLPEYANDAVPRVYLQPPSNSNVVLSVQTNTTIWFPSDPQDGARMSVTDAGSLLGAVLTIDGNGHFIEGLSTYVSPAQGLRRSWFYRADLATWIALKDLLLTDVMPLPTAYDDLWRCGLAMRLAARFGLQPNENTVRALNTVMGIVEGRYYQYPDKPVAFSYRNRTRQAFAIGSVGYGVGGSFF